MKKKFTQRLLFIGVCMLLTVQFISASSGNLAESGTIYSSSVFSNAANAIDGNGSTYAFASYTYSDPSIIIQLDDVFLIGQILVNASNDYFPITCSISVSETAAGPYTSVGSSQSLPYDVDGFSSNAQYVKVTFDVDSEDELSVYEIEVYETAPPIVFGYDEAGNRTSRTIEIPSSLKKGVLDEDYIPEEFTDNLEELSFKMYPNPTKGLLTVEIENFTEETNASISIYDLQGRLIHSIKNATASNAVDLSNQSPGTYIMILKAGDKTSEWKIVKE